MIKYRVTDTQIISTWATSTLFVYLRAFHGGILYGDDIIVRDSDHLYGWMEKGAVVYWSGGRFYGIVKTQSRNAN